jgi:hypothetical protein
MFRLGDCLSFDKEKDANLKGFDTTNLYKCDLLSILMRRHS